MAPGPAGGNISKFSNRPRPRSRPRPRLVVWNPRNQTTTSPRRNLPNRPKPEQSGPNRTIKPPAGPAPLILLVLFLLLGHQSTIPPFHCSTAGATGSEMKNSAIKGYQSLSKVINGSRPNQHPVASRRHLHRSAPICGNMRFERPWPICASAPGVPSAAISRPCPTPHPPRRAAKVAERRPKSAKKPGPPAPAGSGEPKRGRCIDSFPNQRACARPGGARRTQAR